jgi:hypothetical protein
MNLHRGFCIFSWGLAFAISLSAFAAPSSDSRPYVLYYEGPIAGDSTLIHQAAQGTLKDLDRAKVDNEFFIQNIPGSNQYVIEAAIQAKSDESGIYVRDFVSAHNYITVGNVKLAWRRANQVTEFFSINGFGPNQAGDKESQWGEFSRVRSFASLGEYTTSIVTLGSDLDRGNFLRAIPSVLNPVDTLTFLGWLHGVGTPIHKLSRFSLESHSFFSMEDGSFVSRGITYHMDKSL